MKDLSHLGWAPTPDGAYVWAPGDDGEDLWISVEALIPALAPLLARVAGGAGLAAVLAVRAAEAAKGGGT